MKLEKNIQPTKRARGFWHEVAKKMEIGNSLFPLDLNDSICLYKAMEKLGFVGKREKVKNEYRMWRIK